METVIVELTFNFESEECMPKNMYINTHVNKCLQSQNWNLPFSPLSPVDYCLHSKACFHTWDLNKIILQNKGLCSYDSLVSYSILCLINSWESLRVSHKSPTVLSSVCEMSDPHSPQLFLRLSETLEQTVASTVH